MPKSNASYKVQPTIAQISVRVAFRAVVLTPGVAAGSTRLRATAMRP
jgi:hypothetical protein